MLNPCGLKSSVSGMNLIPHGLVCKIHWIFKKYIINFHHICSMNTHAPINEWKEELAHGDVRALARAITLIESYKDSDQDKKVMLLQAIQEIRRPAVKIGITGSPGVGKSTFLNGFVSLFRDTTHKIAILTIDPSSTQTGGSILGDKLRMKDLVNMDQVYIRPSPSKGYLGGINLTTWETIQLCEAAGFDYIFVETVGIGQSEIEVQYLTNEVWYITMARSGDEIQGIKRGILEVVNRIIVTKTDLDPYGAQKTKALLQQSLKSHSSSETQVGFYEVSALKPETFQPLFADLLNVTAAPLTREQMAFWFNRGWQETLIRFIESDYELKKTHQRLLDQVETGQTDYWTAMAELNILLHNLWGK